MNVLVTGGAGFIGSNIVEKMLQLENIKLVRVLDNLSTGFKQNLDKIINNEKLEIIYGDTRNYNTCKQACKNIHVVLHQAALGSVPRSHKNPMDSHTNNVNGFLNMLEAAKHEGIKRFVYASSSSVYGNSKVPENLDFCKPISFYGMTKHVNDLYASIYTKIFGMECIGLRYHNVFGKNQSSKGEYSAVIPIFISNAKNNKDIIIHGDGSQYRDFTHVDNVVHANILAMNTKNSKAYGKSFDIGSDTNVTIIELANIIIQKCNSKSDKIFVNTREGDIHGSCANMNISKDLICYTPVTDFPTGIEKTISSFF
jgi:UDP-N-acetylglucosamine 4-epimerase